MRYAMIVLFSFMFVWNSKIEPQFFPEVPLSLAQIPETCPQPITWRIGKIDPRFDIDSHTLKSIMIEIGDLWSGAAGQEMITYSNSGEVAVNFIYTEKQSLTESEKELSDRINKMKLQYYAQKGVYQELWNEYQDKLTIYNESLSNYEENMKQYRQARNRWSNRDVIPREEDSNLKELKKKIDYWKTREERDLENLNTVIEEMRKQSEILNKLADNVNELVFHYREHFEMVDLFHQGVYLQAGDQKKINIYQYENHDKLKLVLAHEVGHAIGLKHAGNPKSVMYYLMEEQNARNLQLTEEDIESMIGQCKN